MPPTARPSPDAAATARLPLADVRVIEKSETLAGRLAALLLDDADFERGKFLLPAGRVAHTSSADVVIVDGDEPKPLLPGGAP